MATARPRPLPLPTRPGQALPITTAPPALLVSLEAEGEKCGSLSVAAAWEIAMAWEPSLRNHVRLVTARDGPVDSILDSYAWVLFDAEGMEEVFVARAAAVAWFLLSCCPGYAGHENPVFWKCVFSALSQRVGSREGLKLFRDVSSVNDAIGFFDQPGHDFPRFMVGGGRHLQRGELTELLLFFGLGDVGLPATTSAKLLEISVQLDVFVDSSRLARRPEVCLARLTGNRHHAHFNLFIPALQQFFSLLKNPPMEDGSGRPNQVWFRLKEIRFSHNYAIRCDAHAEQLNHLMSAEPVDIGRFQWDMNGPAKPSVSGQAKLVHCMLALDRHVIQAKTTTIQLISWNNPVFEPFVAALPFARSMHTIHYTAPSPSQAFDDHDLPWLAYAMFHPDAKTSTWCSLQMEDVSLTHKSIVVIHAMASGNNLLAALHGSSPISDAYYRARVVAGTAVKAEPTDTADVLVAGDVVEWVDVCDIASLDGTTWAEWVAVVVPAYGLGWMQSKDLLDVEARPPSKSALRALTLRRRGIEMDGDHEVLANFVSSIGSNLQFLNIEGYCEMRSLSTLQYMLTHCSFLEVLEVGHSGELWSPKGSPHAGILPRLKQLHLHLAYPPTFFHQPTLGQLRSSLSELDVLRIQPESYYSIVESHEALEYVLTHAQKLQVLHWASGLQKNGTGTPRPYAKTIETSTRLLRQMEFSNDLHLLVDGYSDQARVAAFISVVQTYSVGRTGDKRQGVGQLNVDLLANVFQFVISRARRILLLEPSTDEVMSSSSRNLR